MKTIKIGKKVYEIKPYDYIVYNGLWYEFVRGQVDGFNITLTKKAIESIDFSKMKWEFRLDNHTMYYRPALSGKYYYFF